MFYMFSTFGSNSFSYSYFYLQVLLRFCLFVCVNGYAVSLRKDDFKMSYIIEYCACHNTDIFSTKSVITFNTLFSIIRSLSNHLTKP